MRWSQLKARAESMLAEPLRQRIAFHSTRYRHSHDSEGRGWITVDGVQVHDMSTLRAWAEQHRIAVRAMANDAREGSSDWDDLRDSPNYWEQWRTAEQARVEKGIFTSWEFNRALWDYTQLPLERALESSNVVVRALAMLDRRLGKRRFLALEMTETDHPLVRSFYRLRADAEGWAL